MEPISSYIAFMPMIILVVGIILALLGDLYVKNRGFVTAVTVLSLVGAMLAALSFEGYVNPDNGTDPYFEFGLFFKVFAVIGLSASIIVAFCAMRDFQYAEDLGLFYALLLISNIGGLVIASSKNFIPAYVGFELMAIPTYGMVAYKTRSKPVAEAAMKLFLLGALSSAIVIFGLSLLYGATGSLYFNTVAISDELGGLKLAASIFLITGTSFKLGLVPFHYWISDVYVGAPISVVNFLAAASKKMGFAFVFQIFMFGIPEWTEYWGALFGILAIITMIIGNTLAIIQNRVMRIVAYSSIAQAGYIAIALAAFAFAPDSASRDFALTAAVIHIFAHVLMKGALITGIIIVVDSFGNDHIENLRGLIHKSPVVGATMVIALFSLMGIPPLAGFIGKYVLFVAAVQTTSMIGYLMASALVLGSVISIYYYTRLIRIIVDDPTNDIPVKPNSVLSVLLVILTIITIFFVILLPFVDLSAFTYF
jgi:proton-translocating NADH-quinone oxidoreductase chain N